ncbi:MAG: hypothetical protein GF417_07595 [Candidatus Latescibacteria bacterium]|nr:hypothetical protein [bacterium]MBD3424283.1 hypothetical protein [Candidatus Latescibacterota bacterium]
MRIFTAVTISLLILFPPMMWGQEDSQVPEYFKDLPRGISIKRSFFISGERVTPISEKLGAGIDKISNTVFEAYGRPIQINIIYTPSETDAEKAYLMLLKVHGGDTTYCFREGNNVFEFAKAGPALVRRVSAAFGLNGVRLPGSIHYRITAGIALLEEPSYMTVNRTINLFARAGKSIPEEEAEEEIRELCAEYGFGNSLLLRKPGIGGTSSSYRFAPGKADSQVLEGGCVVEYTFESSSKRFGVPYITVSMDITTENLAFITDSREGSSIPSGPTEFWPADDPGIMELASRITAGSTGNEEKVESILEWLKPGVNIDFGARKGTRWGVRNVLENRRGRCLDFADLFITLCRAVDIPARLVGGWVYESSGHAWAEVMVDERGWKQVDPSTGSMDSVGAYYIPYFTSETGRMPILYTHLPEIEIIDRD